MENNENKSDIEIKSDVENKSDVEIKSNVENKSEVEIKSNVENKPDIENSVSEKKNIFQKLGKEKTTVIAAIAIAVIATIIIVIAIASGKKSEPVATPEPVATKTPTASPEPTKTPAANPIDFEAWQAYNPDVYAWIYVPGTSVNYPILQNAPDNTNIYYYLDYNIDGSKGYPGCIYTEPVNSKDFSDMHTVLYGHNMHAGYKYKGLDGTMFRTLHNFEDADFFNTHRYFYVYTPTEVLTYEIFAAYTYDNRHLLNSYSLETEGVFQEYINNIYLQKKGHIREDAATVTAADKILTMETCTGNDSTRWLVVGVLRSKENSVYTPLPDDDVTKQAVSVSSYATE